MVGRHAPFPAAIRAAQDAKSRVSRGLGPPPRAGAAPGAAATEPITLPLNFYDVLRVNRASSREAVKRAYEKAVGAPPDVGYSQDTLFSRAVLLKSAAECLSDLDSRRAYDAAAAAGGGEHALDVSRDNLPGALVLLQEAGDSALVLQLGCRWGRPCEALRGAVGGTPGGVVCGLAACVSSLLGHALGTRTTPAGNVNRMVQAHMYVCLQK